MTEQSSAQIKIQENFHNDRTKFSTNKNSGEFS